MLSIDEAIEHARENYNDIINTTYNKCQYEHLSCDGCATPTCKEIADENLQIAEWLEELNLLRLQNHLGRDEAFNAGRKQGYNKAIDDFVQLVKKYDWNIRNRNENAFIYGAIDTLAEQLKAGGENDKSI